MLLWFYADPLFPHFYTVPNAVRMKYIVIPHGNKKYTKKGSEIKKEVTKKKKYKLNGSLVHNPLFANACKVSSSMQ